MAQPTNLSAELNLRRGDRFAAVRSDAEAHVASHGCETWLPGLHEARQLAGIVAAARATYVLAMPSALGYLTLHLAEVFGHTGRMDVLENEVSHASLIETAARTHGLADRIVIHGGRPAEAIPSLNGPFDVVLLDHRLASVAGIYEVLLRLIRTGGSLVIANTPDLYAAATGESHEAIAVRAFLERLALDEQVYAAFSPGGGPVIAVRRR